MRKKCKCISSFDPFDQWDGGSDIIFSKGVVYNFIIDSRGKYKVFLETPEWTKKEYVFEFPYCGRKFEDLFSISAVREDILSKIID